MIAQNAHNSASADDEQSPNVGSVGSLTRHRRSIRGPHSGNSPEELPALYVQQSRTRQNNPELYNEEVLYAD
ncbi:MAG: hypothetical protein OXI96_06395 [Acidimicrobiaceae bacterium]|nr:hypothetical protein [Acidimicrobiaceae bacterium]